MHQLTKIKIFRSKLPLASKLFNILRKLTATVIQLRALFLVLGVFGHRKRRFSNTLSWMESFEYDYSSHSCGRAKTEIFKYDDVMPRFKARSSTHTIRKRYVSTQIF